MAFGVCWDMDGVLVDTGEYHYQTWVEVLRKRGIPFSRERFESLFGMNNADTLTALLGEGASPELIKTIGHEKETLFRAAIEGNVEPLPGVLDWLRALQAGGVRQAVASSAPQANIDVTLDGLALRPYFDATVSSVELRGKPAPDVFLRAAEAIGVPPDRCLVVEDAIAGVEAAKRAGMACLAVTTTNPADALQAADLVVGSLADLDPVVVGSLIDAGG